MEGRHNKCLLSLLVIYRVLYSSHHGKFQCPLAHEKAHKTVTKSVAKCIAACVRNMVVSMLWYINMNWCYDCKYCDDKFWDRFMCLFYVRVDTVISRNGMNKAFCIAQLRHDTLSPKAKYCDVLWTDVLVPFAVTSASMLLPFHRSFFLSFFFFLR